MSKKCNTCKGYGLWGMGDSAPMGPIDAEDGMPTIECPECGANANPTKPIVNGTSKEDFIKDITKGTPNE